MAIDLGVLVQQLCRSASRGHVTVRASPPEEPLREKSMTVLSGQQRDLLVERVAVLVGAWQPPRGRKRAVGVGSRSPGRWWRCVTTCRRRCWGLPQRQPADRLPGRRRVARGGRPGRRAGHAEPGRDGSRRAAPLGRHAAADRQARVRKAWALQGKRHRAGMNLQVVSDAQAGWCTPATRSQGRCATRARLPPPG